MAWYKNHWKAQENKPISASGLADIARTCDWISKLRGAAPLALSNIAGGPLLSIILPPSGKQLAKTDGTITARSGTTAGSGNVFLVTVSGTTLTVGTVDTHVLNFSSTTGGIPTGTYVWIEQDSSGNWWITAVDCGN